jgi:M6 family metalloprotease-like protein
MRLSILLPTLAALLAPSTLVHAQDVLQRGDERAVNPPQWIREALARDSMAFQFKRAWRRKLDVILTQRARAERRGVNTDTLTRLDASLLGAVMTGILDVPVLPLLFADSPGQPYPAHQLEARLFDADNPNARTLATYYDEVSRGMFRVTGQVQPWTRLSIPTSTAVQGPPALGAMLREVLDAVDKTVDFRSYDRNGDNYVDVVAFVQPGNGGECPGSANVWSHRWTFGDATGERLAYRTNDGVFISDYVIQPALDCDGRSPIKIGVFAHELGHALGLPDLYSTADPRTNNGIGNWGLMGYGGWNKPDSPSYMEAWSRAELGWLRVQTVKAGQTITLPPVNRTGLAARIDIPNAPGEYFLLENRQAIGSDRHLIGAGLLVWHIDSSVIADRFQSNTVQNDRARRGVTLVEADGRSDLDNTDNSLGDDSDPFPGADGKQEFTPLTVPSSEGFGGPSGIALRNIRTSGRNITFQVSFDPVVASSPLPDMSALGPYAILRYSGPITTNDTANLSGKGFQVLKVFEASNSVYVRVPANLSGPLSKISPKLDSISTQQRPSTPP